MRKILAIFSSLTLVSTGVFSTVLACKKTITPSINTNNNNNNKVTITNNSLNNIKTVSATLLKQVAIADYYGYNFEFLKSYFNNKNFFQQAKNYNINAEVKDKITLSTDFEDALENYFGKSLIIKKNENINLDGIKGTDTDFLTSVLPKTLFGLTSEQISGAISLILENLSSAGIVGILDLGKNFDINNKFADIINNLKISKDIITTILNAIFSNPKFLEELNKEIETFDALTLYKDFELSELNNLALLNILDGINGILDKDYNLVSAEVKPNNGLNVKLWETSKTFIRKIRKFDNKTSVIPSVNIISNNTNNNQPIIPDNIKRHIKVAASLIRGLELFQYLFSLFDETRKEKFNISSDNIFNKSKKNTDFIKELYGINNINGSSSSASSTSSKKISSLNNNGSSGSNSKTTLNLKYLIDTLNYYLGSVNKKGNAYRLRQFAAILFSGKYIENKYKNENSTTSSGSENSGTNVGQNYNSLFFEFNGSQNNTIKEIKLNGFQTFLVAILFESLSNIKLKNLKFDSPIFSIAKTYIEKIDLKNFFESELFLKKGLADVFISLLNLIIDSFVSNKPIIDDNFVKVIENISIILKNLKLDELLKSLLKDNNETINFIKTLLEKFVKFDDISTKIDNFIKNEPTFSLVKSGIKSLIPILGENFFEYIYDKNVEQTFDTIAALTNDSVTKLVLEKFNIKIPAALNFIFPYFKKVAISLRNIFPNNIHLNLQNLFSIKLSDFIRVDTYPNFGSYYLDKSITEILNEISNSDSSDLKLKDLDKAYGFSIISLKNFVKGIFEYKYKWNNGKEGKKNLFSIILENPNKFKEVIGLTDEGMKENSNSLIDLLFNKLIPSDKAKNQDSLKWFAGLLNNVIINLNKKPNFTTSLEKHFSDQRFNKFEFSETKKENSGLIISQSVSITINDQKYAIIVRRDLKQSTFIVETIKKETIQNNI
ncbi:putative lipoprotein [Mycoplasma leachii PG50]|uniref:Putative lipoprotein n=1 Tax=Mycoplasma leachii (strain DSM 21131 / NCTC 10133 / N29 / PG50) TaxID=880447 RepID=E4PUS7_MYCLG|nr:MOLPALP family lipoprotein [Mycoplasma leachii]ADR24555.1 putative lipoprotein [Mycoplasma leachii PG50]